MKQKVACWNNFVSFATNSEEHLLNVAKSTRKLISTRALLRDWRHAKHKFFALH